MATTKPEDRSQLDKFKDLARELEADEDEARLEETVGKIAPKDRKRAAAGWRRVRRFKISRYWVGRLALGVVCIALAVFVGRAIPLLGYFLAAIGLALMLPLKAGDHAG